MGRPGSDVILLACAFVVMSVFLVPPSGAADSFYECVDNQGRITITNWMHGKGYTCTPLELNQAFKVAEERERERASQPRGIAEAQGGYGAAAAAARSSADAARQAADAANTSAEAALNAFAASRCPPEERIFVFPDRPYSPYPVFPYGGLR